MLYEKNCACCRYLEYCQYGNSLTKVNGPLKIAGTKANQPLNIVKKTVKSLGLNDQIGRKLISSTVIDLCKELMVSQLFQKASGKQTKAKGSQFSRSKPEISRQTDISVENTTEVNVENTTEVSNNLTINNNASNENDGSQKEVESILSSTFPMERTTVLGFESAFWIGLWGGIQDNQAILTNAQLYNLSGEAIGNPQEIVKIPTTETTYVVHYGAV